MEAARVPSTGRFAIRSRLEFRDLSRLRTARSTMRVHGKHMRLTCREMQCDLCTEECESLRIT